MRAFIAIVPDQNVRQKLLSIINQLKYSYRDQLTFTSEEKLHVTLQFFSNLKSEHVSIICEKILPRIKLALPLQLQITRKIVLPNNHFPTVLACEVNLTKELQDIKNYLKDELERLSYSERHNSFLPHITIARSSHHELLQQIELPELNFDFILNEINLFESRPEKGGFAYYPLG